MPTVRYIARHDDLDTFTHGKIDVPGDEYDKVINEASLGVKSSSRTLVFLYRKVLLQYEKRGLQCHVCGNKRTFVPNPVFTVTADPDYATQECTLRGTVHAKCLHCLFSSYVSQ